MRPLVAGSPVKLQVGECLGCFADHGIKAINGHTMELDGEVLIVKNHMP